MSGPPILVADVGGTNSRVALADGGTLRPGTTTRYRNADHSGLGEIVARFRREHGDADCRGACIAMAGPVLDGVGRLTNVGWTLTRDELAAATGVETASILNDLQAQGHALDHLDPQAVFDILPGADGAAHTAQMVIGIGTGFNAVPVFRTDTGRYVPPCESGHKTIPVLTDDDFSLARHVARHHGFPGVEDVLSGRGLERVYDWAAGRETGRSSAEIVADLGRGDDAVAERAGEAFVRALGRVAGDLALTHLPFGGIFLVGGMANAMRPHLGRFGFAEAFRDKGRFSEFMDRFAIRGIEDDYAALTGCAQHMNELIAQGH